MNKIYLVIDTHYRGKRLLLEFPFSSNSFDAMKLKYSHQHETKIASSLENKAIIYNEDDKINIEKHKTQNDFLDDITIANIFTIEQKKRGNFIFDIRINESRYISFPIWLDVIKYMQSKKTEDEEIEEENIIAYDNTEERNLKREGKIENKYCK